MCVHALAQDVRDAKRSRRSKAVSPMPRPDLPVDDAHDLSLPPLPSLPDDDDFSLPPLGSHQPFQTEEELEQWVESMITCV